VQVANGHEGTYKFARKSKEFPLDDATLSDLASSTLYVRDIAGTNSHGIGARFRSAGRVLMASGTGPHAAMALRLCR
jgi:hypothetical protein